jgi:hypothetical protein
MTRCVKAWEEGIDRRRGEGRREERAEAQAVHGSLLGRVRGRDAIKRFGQV